MPGVEHALSIQQFAGSIEQRLIKLSRGFSYFSGIGISEEDLREYVQDPVGALPGLVCQAIAPVGIVLVPYLASIDGVEHPFVVEKASDADTALRSAYLPASGFAGSSPRIFFAVKDVSPSDYHQVFFSTIAHLLGRRVSRELQTRYQELVLTEMAERVHGEVDRSSWERKQSLPRRGVDHKPNVRSRLFTDYVTQSFSATMALYMHGICCDIDVDTGPQQMPSRWLRKRLEALYEMFPPPNQRPVLPEHLSRR